MKLNQQHNCINTIDMTTNKKKKKKQPNHQVTKNRQIMSRTHTCGATSSHLFVSLVCYYLINVPILLLFCTLFSCFVFTVDAQLISSPPTNYPNHQYQQQQQQQYYQQQQLQLQQQPQNRFHQPYQQQQQDSRSQSIQSQQQAHHFTSNRVFSCGKLYYNTFHLDQQRDALYIGAM